MREYPDTGLVQTAATIAGIALALAALLDAIEPHPEWYQFFQIGLLFAGFFAVLGSVFAIYDVRDRMRANSSHASLSLLMIELALYATGVVYIAFLFQNARQ